ncbi:MAG: ABC transporter substrate-binding protein [Alphaproteobacteria bacterium]|nr:ABC transporter substrate-binding protein [Alphaproteobacteria bacterium]
MRRRDFTIGVLLARASGVLAQEPAKQHRIAIVVASGPAIRVNDPASRYWQAFWAELRRLGDIEGQNLTVERYSAEGRPKAYADLALDVVNRNPDAIVAISGPMSQTVSAATATIPIIASGFDPEHFPNLARPVGNITGITVNVGSEINGKRLQILKEAVPLASKVAVLDMRAQWEGSEGQKFREPAQRLAIPLIPMLLEQSTPSEVQRVFAQISQKRPGAIIVSDISKLVPHRQLIVELVEKSRLPAMYPFRDWAEAGGLMAYGSDFVELWRRLANDLHQVLIGAKPGDIPVYQPTKFEFLINLKAANALGLTIPPALLATADEVIE